MTDLISQVHSGVRGLTPYERESVAAAIDLSDNTNAFGAPPSALGAVRAASVEQLSRYPTSYSRALREAIAGYVGVSSDEVVVGCGSDDIMDCAFRTFGRAGSRLATMHPSFVMARIFALTNGIEPVPVNLRPDFDLDPDALLGTGAEITYLCSPNNPTGTVASRSAIDRVVDGARGLVVLDEAYAEYSGGGRATTAPAHPRLLVLRTFSKAFGLAGLRVGYGVACREIITELEKVRGPYKVSSLGERAALATLDHDQGWVAESVSRTVELRDRFVTGLSAAGFSPVASHANFVLVPVAECRSIQGLLRARNIAVRAFPGLPHVGDALRITIGAWSALEAVLQALVDLRNR